MHLYRHSPEVVDHLNARHPIYQFSPSGYLLSQVRVPKERGHCLTDPYGHQNWRIGTEEDCICLDYARAGDVLVLHAVMHQGRAGFTGDFAYRLHLIPRQVDRLAYVTDRVREFMRPVEEWTVSNQLTWRKGSQVQGPKRRFCATAVDAFSARQDFWQLRVDGPRSVTDVRFMEHFWKRGPHRHEVLDQGFEGLNPPGLVFNARTGWAMDGAALTSAEVVEVYQGFLCNLANTI